MSMRCERDREKDEYGNDDPELISIGTPLTTSYVNRTTARVTAQPPNIRFRCKNDFTSELISRTLMYQWDKSQSQRLQKRHVRQATLFGWSVRGWSWCRDEVMRKKRVNPFDATATAQETLTHLQRSYGDQIAETFGVRLIPADPILDIGVESALPPADEQQRVEILQWLVGKYGRGQLVDVAYSYIPYEGPKPYFLSVADCFPEPNFEYLQESNWFIVQRRYPRSYFDTIKKLLTDEGRVRLDEVLRDHKHGTMPIYDGSTSKDTQNFRSYMARAYGDADRFNMSGGSGYNTNMWTWTQQYVPGSEPKLSLLCEDQWIDEIPLPMDLEGRIPFTDLIFIDDMLGGIGESMPRYFRGIQQLFDKHTNMRWRLIDRILRPLTGTSDPELYDDPSRIKPLNGMRLVFMRRGPQSLWQENQQAAVASAAAGAGDIGPMLQLFQMATGESSMAMMMPQDRQAATATGTRAQAHAQDILTKDLNDMFLHTSLREDAWMMYLLNRSEMTEPIEFEPSRYVRHAYQDDPLKQQWVQVTPEQFQADGEIMVEAGSTIADDDDAKSQRALQIWGVAAARPDLFNQQTARDEYLKAMGYGNKLNEWAAPPPPAPAPKPPDPAKTNISIKFEDLLGPEREAALKMAGLPVSPATPPAGVGPSPNGPSQPGAEGAPPPIGPPAMGAMPPPPPPPSMAPSPAENSLAAAMGRR